MSTNGTQHVFTHRLPLSLDVLRNITNQEMMNQCNQQYPAIKAQYLMQCEDSELEKRHERRRWKDWECHSFQNLLKRLRIQPRGPFVLR